MDVKTAAKLTFWSLIFCEIKFLICSHEIPSLKFEIFETVRKSKFAQNIFSRKDILLTYY